MTLRFALWLFAALLALPCVAQELTRDPTRMPGAATPSGSESNVAQRSLPLLPGEFAVLMRGGVLHLVVDARLYSVGQSIGGARIERLSETEVWLRDAAGLHKLPVFAGVQRRTLH